MYYMIFPDLKVLVLQDIVMMTVVSQRYVIYYI